MNFFSQNTMGDNEGIDWRGIFSPLIGEGFLSPEECDDIVWCFENDNFETLETLLSSLSSEAIVALCVNIPTTSLWTLLSAILQLRNAWDIIRFNNYSLIHICIERRIVQLHRIIDKIDFANSQFVATLSHDNLLAITDMVTRRHIYYKTTAIDRENFNRNCYIFIIILSNLSQECITSFLENLSCRDFANLSSIISNYMYGISGNTHYLIHELIKRGESFMNVFIIFSQSERIYILERLSDSDFKIVMESYFRTNCINSTLHENPWPILRVCILRNAIKFIDRIFAHSDFRKCLIENGIVSAIYRNELHIVKFVISKIVRARLRELKIAKVPIDMRFYIHDYFAALGETNPLGDICKYYNEQLFEFDHDNCCGYYPEPTISNYNLHFEYTYWCGHCSKKYTHSPKMQYILRSHSRPTKVQRFRVVIRPIVTFPCNCENSKHGDLERFEFLQVTDVRAPTYLCLPRGFLKTVLINFGESFCTYRHIGYVCRETHVMTEYVASDNSFALYKMLS